MPRIKRGTHAHNRKKKILKLAKGKVGAKSKLFRSAKEALERALSYAYRDRRRRKRDFRALWITRINAAARLNGTTYRDLIYLLTKKGIKINRKILADMAVKNPLEFSNLVNELQA